MKFRFSISLLCLFFVLPAFAQNVLPEEPRPKAPATHSLFDWKNSADFSAIAASTGIELGTQPHSKNAAVPLVQLSSTAGVMAFSHFMETRNPGHQRVWHFIERAAPAVTLGFQLHSIVHNLNTNTQSITANTCTGSSCKVGKL